jgi:glycine/D-amino acid oxidase-like deaminating enzyme
LITDRGEVRARRAIVLAGEAYLSRLPKLRRHVIPMTSHIVITEPLPSEIWAQIGWAHRDVAVGFGSTAGYLNHTADGRIAFGAYRSHYPFGSHISDDLDRMPTMGFNPRTGVALAFGYSGEGDDLPPENWSRDNESPPEQDAPRRTRCARAGSVRSRSSVS